MRTTLLLFALLFLSAAFLATEARSQSIESGPVGVYADHLQGRTTASGTLYDRGAMTAAHATLPFGTRLRVANYETGRMADVIVNDRKAKDGHPVIVSRAAADALGLAPHATALASVLVLSAPAVTPAAAPPAAETPSDRKFRPFAGLFGKDSAPAPAQTSAAAPLRYGIPSVQQDLPAAPAEGALFSKLGKGGGLFASRPAVPAPVYPTPFPVPQAGTPALPATSLLAMPAAAGAVPVPGTAPSPVAAQTFPPASPSAPYRVQFGAFRRVASADELSAMLDGAGIPTTVYLAPGTGMNVVVTDAGFRTAEEAQRWIDYEGGRRGWTERPLVIR